MRCTNCEALGVKSRLDVKHLTPSIHSEVERFWDEDENFHVHDHAIYQTVLTCTLGHNNVEKTRGRCPVVKCSWNDQLVVP